MKNKVWLLLFLMFLVVGCNNDDNGNNENNNNADVPETDIIEYGTTELEKSALMVYYFWGDGCPHCEDQREYLEKWAEAYPEITIVSFETWQTPENVDIMREIGQVYDTEVRGVPATFIGDRFWTGFSAQMASQMEQKIKQCLEDECVDKVFDEVLEK